MASESSKKFIDVPAHWAGLATRSVRQLTRCHKEFTYSWHGVQGRLSGLGPAVRRRGGNGRQIMAKTLRGVAIGIAVASLGLTFGPIGAAGASQAVGDYQFQGSCANSAASDVGQYLDGPAGTPTIRACGSSDFTTDTVDGQTQQVLNLPVADQGVEVPAPSSELVNGPGEYTIAICTKLDSVDSGYVRLIDFTDGQSDNGLYEVNNGQLNFYNHATSSDSPITAGKSTRSWSPVERTGQSPATSTAFRSSPSMTAPRRTASSHPGRTPMVQ